MQIQVGDIVECVHGCGFCHVYEGQLYKVIHLRNSGAWIDVIHLDSATVTGHSASSFQLSALTVCQKKQLDKGARGAV